MKKENILCFRVYGRKALFSDPVTRTGGEKTSYFFPTYQALKGVAESIYWKPVFTWKILRCRVVNPIQTQTEGIRPIRMSDGSNDLSYYTYLRDVVYEVEARIVWNENRKDLIEDRNENKHYFIAKRMIEKGGRRDVFLGTRECQAYVEPCVWGESIGYYDDQGHPMGIGIQYHSLVYPSDAQRDEEKGMLTALLWDAVMINGVITFPDPEEIPIRRNIREMNTRSFITGVNYNPDEEVL